VRGIAISFSMLEKSAAWADSFLAFLLITTSRHNSRPASPSVDFKLRHYHSRGSLETSSTLKLHSVINTVTSKPTHWTLSFSLTCRLPIS